MRIRVYYEFVPDDDNIVIDDDELKGMSENEAVEYIFDKYVTPFIDSHITYCYDVIQK